MLQKRINHDWLVEGVSIIDASTTYIGRDVEIGADAVIEPGCIITGHSRIGSHAHIGAYSILHDVVVEDGEQIDAYTKR
jgi:bifunctional UDP-N-acetylglucosamine pyrophosphorylase/glucosamine-1-phosphate N-acetyltransferase